MHKQKITPVLDNSGSFPLVKLFGRGEVRRSDLEALRERMESRLAQQESVLRQMETEQTALHAEVKKWMRRAVAAERAAERAAPAAGPATGFPQIPMWGARRRRALRQLHGDPAEGPAPEESANGVHP